MKIPKYQKLAIFICSLALVFFVIDDASAGFSAPSWGPINCDPHGDAQFCGPASFSQGQTTRQVYGFNWTIVTHGHGFLTHVLIWMCLVDDARTTSAGCPGINVTNDDIGTDGTNFTYNGNLFTPVSDYTTDWSWVEYRADVEDAHSGTTITTSERWVTIDYFRPAFDNYNQNVGSNFLIEWDLDWPVGGATLNWTGAGVLSQGTGSENLNPPQNGSTSGRWFTCSSPGTASFTLSTTGPGGNGPSSVSSTINVNCNAPAGTVPLTFTVTDGCSGGLLGSTATITLNTGASCQVPAGQSSCAINVTPNTAFTWTSVAAGYNTIGPSGVNSGAGGATVNITQTRGCSGGGACNNGVDAGLRLYQDGVRRVAVEPGAPTSRLRIFNRNTTYGVVLVAPGSANASKVRVQTPSGIMALCMLP